jgi:alkylation response protein AidB-like acyl-CoA dehydrogenase
MTTDPAVRAGASPLFDLTPELKAFRERVRNVARAEIAPHAAETDRTEQYPWHCVEVLKREGFMGMTIPAEYGGRGASYLEAVLLIEEMAKACSTTGRICVESNMGALGAIMRYGSEAQKRLAARLVLAGDKPAILITEPQAGSAATEMTTRADHVGDGTPATSSTGKSTGSPAAACRACTSFSRGCSGTAPSRALPASSSCATRPPAGRGASSSASASRRWACAASPRPR